MIKLVDRADEVTLTLNLVNLPPDRDRLAFHDKVLMKKRITTTRDKPGRGGRKQAAIATEPEVTRPPVPARLPRDPDGALDEALKESFPASDPPAVLVT